VFDRLFSTFSLVSRIPPGRRFAFDPSRIDFWLPVVGVVPALLVALALVALALAGDIPGRHPFLAAAVSLAVQYLCFNLFHLDGLMDTADAFLGTCTGERRLAIMKDSRVGVYGFFAGFASLALKLALLEALLSGWYDFSGLAVACAFPIVGRFAAALVPCLSPPAPGSGMGRLMEGARWWRCIGGGVLAFALWMLFVFGAYCATGFASDAASPSWAEAGAWFAAELSEWLGGLAAWGAPLASLAVLAPLTALFYARLFRRGVGGYTGDALGAAVETGELLALSASFLALDVWGV
jgi:adenosylcobinamide-GDP ribazoletransferase